MKTIFIFVFSLLANVSFSQQKMKLVMQNYSPHQIHYVITKRNWGPNNCNESWASQSISTDAGGLAILKQPVYPEPYAEVIYSHNLRESYETNGTKRIDGWRLHQFGSNTFVDYDCPNVPIGYSENADWTGIKFGVTDTNGNPLSGYHTMKVTNTPCFPDPNAPNNDPVMNVYIHNGSVAGNMFTLGGSMWMVFH